MRSPDELARIAVLVALMEEPGLEGEALEVRVNELLELGEDGLRVFARTLPGYQLH